MIVHHDHSPKIGEDDFCDTMGVVQNSTQWFLLSFFNLYSMVTIHSSTRWLVLTIPNNGYYLQLHIMVTLSFLTLNIVVHLSMLSL